MRPPHHLLIFSFFKEAHRTYLIVKEASWCFYRPYYPFLAEFVSRCRYRTNRSLCSHALRSH